MPRNDVHVHAMDAAIPGSMGMNTPLNFQLDGKNAAINGDFMLLAAELNPVIKVLRANGIEVASVHNHMLDDEPRLIFMHFWAYGDRRRLSQRPEDSANADRRMKDQLIAQRPRE